jgi:hypothetical protein
MRVLARPQSAALWSHAELAEVDASGQCMAVVTRDDGRRHILPLTALALSAHAPDPDDSGSHGDSEDDPGTSLSFSSNNGGDDEAGSSNGTASSPEDGNGDEADEAEEALGGAAFGRVGWALEGSATLTAQQAQAGSQTDVRLFFDSEAHSRGIGSKVRGGAWAG